MWTNPYSYKILEDLSSVPYLYRNNRVSPLVMAAGCFDLLHPGHIRLLLQARHAYRDSIIFIGLWSDDQIQEIKGVTRPIYNQSIRAEVLSTLDCVDYISVYDERIPKTIIETLQPEVYIKSDNYKLQQIVEASLVEENGGKVVLLPSYSDWSTTNLVSKIRRR